MLIGFSKNNRIFDAICNSDRSNNIIDKYFLFLNIVKKFYVVFNHPVDNMLSFSCINTNRKGRKVSTTDDIT